jgi:hypothetical protein
MYPYRGYGEEGEENDDDDDDEVYPLYRVDVSERSNRWFFEDDGVWYDKIPTFVDVVDELVFEHRKSSTGYENTGSTLMRDYLRLEVADADAAFLRTATIYKDLVSMFKAVKVVPLARKENVYIGVAAENPDDFWDTFQSSHLFKYLSREYGEGFFETSVRRTLVDMLAYLNGHVNINSKYVNPLPSSKTPIIYNVLGRPPVVPYYRRTKQYTNVFRDFSDYVYGAESNDFVTKEKPLLLLLLSFILVKRFLGKTGVVSFDGYGARDPSDGENQQEMNLLKMDALCEEMLFGMLCYVLKRRLRIVSTSENKHDWLFRCVVAYDLIQSTCSAMYAPAFAANVINADKGFSGSHVMLETTTVGKLYTGLLKKHGGNRFVYKKGSVSMTGKAEIYFDYGKFAAVCDLALREKAREILYSSSTSSSKSMPSSSSSSSSSFSSSPPSSPSKNDSNREAVRTLWETHENFFHRGAGLVFATMLIRNLEPFVYKTAIHKEKPLLDFYWNGAASFWVGINDEGSGIKKSDVIAYMHRRSGNDLLDFQSHHNYNLSLQKWNTPSQSSMWYYINAMVSNNPYYYHVNLKTKGTIDYFSQSRIDPHWRINALFLAIYDVILQTRQRREDTHYGNVAYEKKYKGYHELTYEAYQQGLDAVLVNLQKENGSNDLFSSVNDTTPYFYKYCVDNFLKGIEWCDMTYVVNKEEGYKDEEGAMFNVELKKAAPKPQNDWFLNAKIKTQVK